MIIIQGEVNIYILNHAKQISKKKSVINMGIRLYNRLQIDIPKEERYKSYKRKMKVFLIDNAFYSLDEYLNYEDMRLYKNISENASIVQKILLTFEDESV
jgi:hypothetical protein